MRQDHPDAVVADLSEALLPTPAQSAEAGDASPDWTLCVDGRPVAADLTLAEAGLVDGAIITVANVGDQLLSSKPSARDRRASGEDGWDFVVVGGLSSGQRHHLRIGRTLVGRGAKADIVVADPTVSSLHLEMTVAPALLRVSDLGSHNGTRIDDQVVHHDVDLKPGQLVRFGAVEAIVREVGCDDRPAGLDPTRLAVAGKLPFNRPPRPALPPEVEPVAVPDPPADKKRAAAFSVAVMLGPIIMGVVMVQLLGNIRYALFALMSPVMLITNTIGARRRNAKESKTSPASVQRGSGDFRISVGDGVGRRTQPARGVVPRCGRDRSMGRAALDPVVGTTPYPRRLPSAPGGSGTSSVGSASRHGTRWGER